METNPGHHHDRPVAQGAFRNSTRRSGNHVFETDEHGNRSMRFLSAEEQAERAAALAKTHDHWVEMGQPSGRWSFLDEGFTFRKAMNEAKRETARTGKPCRVMVEVDGEDVEVGRVDSES